MSGLPMCGWKKASCIKLTGQADSQELATLFVQRLRETKSWAAARLDLAKAQADETGRTTFIVSGTLQ